MKNVKKTAMTGLAAVLATSAVVPAAVASAENTATTALKEVVLQLTDGSKVQVDYDAYKAAKTAEIEWAETAKVIGTVGSDKVTYDIKDFIEAKTAAEGDLAETLELLTNNKKPAELNDVKPAEVKDGELVIGDETLSTKEDLTKAIEVAQEVAADEKLAADKKEALDAAIKAAQEVADKEDATAEEITAAVKDLKEAVAEAKGPAVAVESVKAINKTDVTVKLAEKPATDLTTDNAASFAVLANGTANVVTNVVKDATDITGKTYKLTLTTTLDKTQGDLTVNGIAPTVKATPGSDFDYDFKAASVVSVTVKGNKTIVVKFDEKMSKTGTELADFQVVKADAPAINLLTAGTSVLSADGTEVTLTLGGTNVMVPAAYKVILGNTVGGTNDVTDLKGNAIYRGTEVTFTPTAEQLEVKAAPAIATAVYNNGTGKLVLTFDKAATAVDVTKLSINGIALTSADAISTSGVEATITLSTATKAAVNALTEALSLTSAKDAYTDGTTATAGQTVAISKISPAVISSGTYNQETNVVTLNFDQPVKIVGLANIKINDETTANEATLEGATKANGTAYTNTELATAASTWTFKLSDTQAQELENAGNDKAKLKAYLALGAVTNNDVNVTPNVAIAYANGGAVTYTADTIKPFIKGITFDYAGANGADSVLTIELNEKAKVNGKLSIATAATGDTKQVDLNLVSTTYPADVKTNKITLNATQLTALDATSIADLKDQFESGKAIKAFFAKKIIVDDNKLENDEVKFADGVTVAYNDYVKPTVVKVAGKDVTVKDSKHISVEFSEPLDATSANTVGNYAIKDATGVALNVVSAELQSDKKTVLITTDAQTSNKPYTLSITGVKDVKGNIIDNVAAGYAFTGTATVVDSKLEVKAAGSSIKLVANANNDEITLAFNQAVNQTAATNIANYALFEKNTADGDKLTKAVSLSGAEVKVGTDGKSVVITLKNGVNLQKDAQYKVRATNLTDIYGNALDTSDAAKYEATLTANTGDISAVAKPTGIASLNANGVGVIELTFDEELNKTNAENKAAYEVAGDATQANIQTVVYTPYDATTKKSKVTITLIEGTNISGTVGVKVKGTATGIVTDLAGNKLAADADLTVAVADLVKPKLATTTPLKATANTLATKDTIELTFSEPIQTTGAVLDERNYTVKINGTTLSAKADVAIGATNTDTPYAVTAVGDKVTITLDDTLVNFVKGDNIEVSIAGDKIADIAGLKLDAATTNVIATAASDADNTAATAVLTDARTVKISFATNGVLASTVAAEDFTIVGGNVINAVTVSGKDVTLTLAAPATDVITVKPSANFAIKDDMGNVLTTATLGNDTGITTTGATSPSELALAAVNDATDAATTGTALVNNAAAIGIVLTDYNNLTAAYKTAVNTTVYNNGSNYGNVGDIKTAFDTAVAAQKSIDTAVKAVNAATDAATTKTALETPANATALNITLTGDYAALSAEAKTAVATKVWNTGTDYTTATAIKAAFDNEVAAQKAIAAITTINTGGAAEADYTAAGIIGVTTANLSDVNTTVAAAKAALVAPATALTKAQIQTAVDDTLAVLEESAKYATTATIAADVATGTDVTSTIKAITGTPNAAVTTAVTAVDADGLLTLNTGVVTLTAQIPSAGTDNTTAATLTFTKGSATATVNVAVTITKQAV